jgi:hypothetical protein
VRERRYLRESRARSLLWPASGNATSFRPKRCQSCFKLEPEFRAREQVPFGVEETHYLKGFPGVDWKPPKSFRPSANVTVRALAKLVRSLAA